ncbi:MAG: carbohydrate-binding protein [Ignavibacteriales bacterium]
MSKVNFSGGVSMDPVPPATGDNITLSYTGLLAQSGADRVFAHVGYGSPQSWFNVKDVEMRKLGSTTFSTTVRVDASDNLQVCFKDSAGNWDNNNGRNWGSVVNSNYR